MTTGHDLAIYKDILIVLATAGVIVPVMQRAKITPVLGYLTAGALLGPNGLGALAGTVPGLDSVVITDVEALSGIAELGVVFLLFLIGLELSAQRLWRMRRLVFGLGGLQVASAALALGLIAPLFGNAVEASVLIGLSLALSSTAVVLEWLSQRKRINSAAGRASFSVLLFQDLAVVPILFLVSILAARENGSVTLGLLAALGQAALTIGLIAIAGGFLLRPLFRLVAGTDSPELFMAATLLVAIGASVATAAAGLSMALGGFVAGLLLAETEYRRAIQTVIEPFKGLLLGVFFILVGTRIDVAALLRDPLFLIACAGGIIALKAALIVPLARGFGLSWPVTAEMALLLGPCGEFAFIILGLASAGGIMTGEVAGLLLAVVALTMAAIPFLGVAGERLAARMEARDPAAEPPPEPIVQPEEVRAIVIGAGRVGTLVSEMLKRHGIPHLLTDRDPAMIRNHRRNGLPVHYGDAKSPEFLKHCRIVDAHAVILTLNAPQEIDAIVTAVRSLRPDIMILVRARDAEHARRLYAEGVTDAVPETIEASLQLSEACLVALGVPTGRVIASIHEKRDEFRQQFQEASVAGATPVRGIRTRQGRRKRAGSR